MIHEDFLCRLCIRIQSTVLLFLRFQLSLVYTSRTSSMLCIKVNVRASERARERERERERESERERELEDTFICYVRISRSEKKFYAHISHILVTVLYRKSSTTYTRKVSNVKKNVC